MIMQKNVIITYTIEDVLNSLYVTTSSGDILGRVVRDWLSVENVPRYEKVYTDSVRRWYKINTKDKEYKRIASINRIIGSLVDYLVRNTRVVAIGTEKTPELATCQGRKSVYVNLGFEGINVALGEYDHYKTREEFIELSDAYLCETVEETETKRAAKKPEKGGVKPTGGAGRRIIKVKKDEQ